MRSRNPPSEAEYLRKRRAGPPDIEAWNPGWDPGASRSHIASQFLLESSVIGFVGGILGASLGVLIIVAVSAYQSWTPVLDASISFASPFVGALVGLIAGTYPATRAARLEPVEALRSGT